jgi:hypothetical protein
MNDPSNQVYEDGEWEKMIHCPYQEKMMIDSLADRCSLIENTNIPCQDCPADEPQRFNTLMESLHHE